MILSLLGLQSFRIGERSLLFGLLECVFGDDSLLFGVRMSGLREAALFASLVALSIGTILIGAVLRRPTVVRSGVRMLASHAVATAAKTAIKNAVDRTRPSRAVEDGHRLEKGDGADDTSLNSMPSGHTAGAVAGAQGVAAESRLAAIGFAAERVTDAVMRRIDAALWTQS